LPGRKIPIAELEAASQKGRENMKVHEIEKKLQLISPDELCDLTDKARNQYMRLVQIHATTLEGRVELNYCFATPGRWLNLRLTVDPQQEVPSISKIYPCAFIYENEIHDLFGIQVTGINIDYQGNLYRLRQQTPFAPVLTAAPVAAPDQVAGKEDRP
jgi:ech hydrogenase subunit D